MPYMAIDDDSRLKMISPPSKSRSSSPEFSPLAIGEDLTPLPEYKAAGSTTLDFSGFLSPPLKLHEDLKSGCGGQLWPAGMVLATHMLRHHGNSLKDAKMFVCPLVSSPLYHDLQSLWKLTQ